MEQKTTQQSIIFHARKLFKEYGYDGTSMQMIADAVSIKKPSLYYYFKNKESLYVEIILSILNEVGSLFDLNIYDSFEERIQKVLKNSQENGFFFHFIPTLTEQGNEKINSELEIFIKKALTYLRTQSLRVSVEESMLILFDVSQSYAHRFQEQGIICLSPEKYAHTLGILLLN